MLISATYKTNEFRESYAAEYINTFMLDGEKGDELMKGEMEAPKKHHEFFLSIHTPNKEWSDLEKKEPIWALYLVNDAGETVSPLNIKRVKERGPGVVRFYPYFTEWSVGYTVKFPLNLPDGREFITAEAKYIKLVLIILMAKYFSSRHVETYKFRHIIFSGLYFALPILLIFQKARNNRC